jgi:hypothetical protein
MQSTVGINCILNNVTGPFAVVVGVMFVLTVFSTSHPLAFGAHRHVADAVDHTLPGRVGALGWRLLAG